MENHKQARDALNEEYNNLKIKRGKAQDEKKDKWKLESEIETELAAAREGTFYFSILFFISILTNDFPYFLAMTKAERQLYGALPKEQSSAIEAIKRMKADPSYNLKGVYAPVIELFTCSEKEMTAIEVAAKGNLFNVVVDTDETASRLLGLYAFTCF